MWLGSTNTNPSYYFDNHEISSVDAIKLLGVRSYFNNHVAAIVRKLSNRLQVIKRHKKLIDTKSKIKLYKAYFLPHLNYCFTDWNFCGKCNSMKLMFLMIFIVLMNNCLNK